MICNKCNKVNLDGASFCAECGASFKTKPHIIVGGSKTTLKRKILGFFLAFLIFIAGTQIIGGLLTLFSSLGDLYPTLYAIGWMFAIIIPFILAYKIYKKVVIKVKQ